MCVNAERIPQVHCIFAMSWYELVVFGCVCLCLCLCDCVYVFGCVHVCMRVRVCVILTRLCCVMSPSYIIR